MMLTPWRVHVLYEDQEKFISSLSRVWDGTLDIFWSPMLGRKLIVCYADLNEKSILYLKFDLAEDSEDLPGPKYLNVRN